MQTLNPRKLVESIYEGVDFVDKQLGRAVDERCDRYNVPGEDRNLKETEHWDRVMANWLIVRHSLDGQIERLLGLIDTANRHDLARMTEELQEVVTCL